LQLSFDNPESDGPIAETAVARCCHLAGVAIEAVILQIFKWFGGKERRTWLVRPGECFDQEYIYFIESETQSSTCCVLSDVS